MTRGGTRGKGLLEKRKGETSEKGGKNIQDKRMRRIVAEKAGLKRSREEPKVPVSDDGKSSKASV